MAGERRREERFLVSNMTARVNGLDCPIIDISRTAVRLLRPAGLVIDPGPWRLCLAYSIGGSGNFVEMEARLIRFGPGFIVLKYLPPHDRWQEDLRALDTFEHAKIDALAF